MNATFQENELTSSSERLVELLTRTGKFKVKGSGLTEEVKVVANVSYNTARKWLFENALPRTSKERVRVASILNIDLLYWEYAFTKPPTSIINIEKDYLFHMKVANAVMTIIHADDLKICPDKVIEIELIILEMAKISNSLEPDINILKALVKLAT